MDRLKAAGYPKPRPPEKPFPDECCGSGCAPCILEVYEDQLDRYKDALAAWQTRQVQRAERGRVGH